MAKGQGKRIPDETRAAIIAGILTGNTDRYIAAQCGVGVGSVARLRKSWPKYAPELAKALDGIGWRNLMF